MTDGARWRRAAAACLVLGAATSAAVQPSEPLVLSLSLPPHWSPGTALWAIWSLQNDGAQSLRVASHVLAAPGPQFDELAWTVCRDDGSACQVLRLQTGRAASFPVDCVLGPGQRLRHRVDLQPWLDRAGVVLAAGRYRWSLAYDRERTGDVDGPSALPDCGSSGTDDTRGVPPAAVDAGRLPDAPPRRRVPSWLGHLRAPPVELVVEPPGR